MTITSPGRATGRDARRRSAIDRAYDRRGKRSRRIADRRFTAVGVPIRQAMARIPFVVVIICLLGAGGVGVLYLNTRTDEFGIRTTQAQQRSAELRLQIESYQRDIADLDAIPRIAEQAQRMGLVQAGDPAIIVIGKDGKARVIGTPHPAAGGTDR